jgi:CheY-like chemotaxis protein
MMPGIDGFETAKVIKADEENRSIPIAMLTVKSGDKDKLRSLEECRVDWHISKPVDREKLVEVVNWLLKSRPRKL